MTAIKYPNEKFVKFQKYEALSEPRLTIFSDIESCHSKFEKLCNICVKAYNVCVDAETRRSIIKSCASENHSAFRVTRLQIRALHIYQGEVTHFEGGVIHSFHLLGSAPCFQYLLSSNKTMEGGCI